MESYRALVFCETGRNWPLLPNDTCRFHLAPLLISVLSDSIIQITIRDSPIYTVKTDQTRIRDYRYQQEVFEQHLPLTRLLDHIVKLNTQHSTFEIAPKIKTRKYFGHYGASEASVVFRILTEMSGYERPAGQPWYWSRI